MNAGIVMQFSYYIFCLSPHVSKYLSIIYDVQDYMSFMKANSIKKLSYPIMHWKIANVADSKSTYKVNFFAGLCPNFLFAENQKLYSRDCIRIHSNFEIL